MNTQFYPDKMSMYRDIGSKVEGLDFNKTIRLPLFGFADQEGKCYLCPTIPILVEKLNSRFGDLISLKGSQYTSYPACIITYLDKDNISTETPKEESSIESLVTEESPTEVESIEETIEEQASEITSEEVVVEETSSSEEIVFDLAYAESLNKGTKKEAKDSLEEYGKNFGIDLMKNKTFANMLLDLQEQVTK